MCCFELRLTGRKQDNTPRGQNGAEDNAVFFEHSKAVFYGQKINSRDKGGTEAVKYTQHILKL